MNNLKAARQRAGLSQAELSRRSGVAPSHISHFEAGRVQPWPKARHALARELGVPESELWPELTARA